MRAAPIFTLVTLLAISGASASEEDRPPHVVLVLAGDLGWGQLSAHGHRTISTPGLDQLATEGMDLEVFFANPEGGTSRAALLTGRYPYRSGVSGSSHGEATLPGFQITLAEILRDHGWKTALFGRWTSGANWPHCPQAQGFDHFEGFFGNPPGILSSISDDVVPTDPTSLVERALSFLDSSQLADQPSFTLLTLPSLVADASRTEETHQAIEELDRAMGTLQKALEEKGLADQTLIWFLADNGPRIPPGTEFGRENAFLRGGRTSVHEGGVRVPSLIRWPGRIPDGSTFSRITTLLDVFPTVLDVAGIDFRSLDLPRLDGLSLAPVFFSGGNPERWPNRVLLNSWTPPGYQTHKASVSVRTDRWLALRDPRWRRTETSENHSGWELYDLRADPYQRTDLADSYPYLLSDLRADFSRWLDHTTDDGLGPIPTEIGHPEWPIVTLDREIIPHPSILPDSSESILSWPIRIIPEDSIEVALEMALRPGSGGTVSLSFEPGNSGRPLPLPLPLPALNQAQWTDAGRHEIPSTATFFRIEGSQLDRVLGVRFRPQDTEK